MRGGEKTRRLAFTGLMFALAIALSYLESMVSPLLLLPPGVKLGLANVVVMFSLLYMGKAQALALAVMKGGFTMLTRGALAGVLSLSGSVLSLCVMLLAFWLLKSRASVVLLSVLGAIFHNLGQVAALRLMAGPFSFYYLPVLLASGVGMGVLTALIFRLVLPGLKKTGFLANSRHERDGKED